MTRAFRCMLAVLFLSGLPGCGPTAQERYATALQIHEAEKKALDAAAVESGLARLDSFNAALAESQATVLEFTEQYEDKGSSVHKEVTRRHEASEPHLAYLKQLERFDRSKEALEKAQAATE